MKKKQFQNLLDTIFLILLLLGIYGMGASSFYYGQAIGEGKLAIALLQDSVPISMEQAFPIILEMKDNIHYGDLFLISSLFTIAFAWLGLMKLHRKAG